MNSRRARARSRKKSLLRKGVILPVLGVAAILVLIIISLNGSPPSQSTIIDSSKYFTISGASAQARYGAGSNTTIIITALSFNFTPIGGDAHEVEIHDPLMSTTENNPYYWDVITNGTSTTSGEIQISGLGIRSIKQPEGYPIKIQITSLEAKGYVSFFIPEDRAHITPQQP